MAGVLWYMNTVLPGLLQTLKSLQAGLGYFGLHSRHDRQMLYKLV